MTENTGTHLQELHFVQRIGWLRAAVMGANDGILSTSSIIIGVSAASASHEAILTAGAAGLVAGAMSMAAGEYVSVSSQNDTEEADLAREREELEADPHGELHELAHIYVERGLSKHLALQVATELMEKDALGAHARDELGIYEHMVARPVQAAVTSAITFAIGGALPLIMATISPQSILIYTVSLVTLIALAVLGALGARTGGASIIKGALRVMIWGVLAMAATAAIGTLFGTGMQ